MVQVKRLKVSKKNEQINEGQFLPLEMGLTDAQSIENSIKKAHEHFGALGVVVNNAAYGIGGPAEELSLGEIRQIFEVNVFVVLFANTVFPIHVHFFLLH